MMKEELRRQAKMLKIVAAFRGMHVSPAKQLWKVWPVTDGLTDDGQSDPYVSLCFAGDTKTSPHALLDLWCNIPAKFHSNPCKDVGGVEKTNFEGTEWQVINVRQILAELLSLILRIFTHFSFSTPPTSLQGFEWNLAGMLHHKSRSACEEIIMFDIFWQSYGPWHLQFLHILACLLNSYILAWIWMKLGRDITLKA